MTISGDEEGFSRLKAELLERFETMLRSDQSVDAISREDMVDALDRAIEAGQAQSAKGGSLSTSLSDGLGSARGALVDRDEHSVVDSAFQVPLEVLQSDSVRCAMEFAQIVRRDGEQAARAWLSQRVAASPKAKGAAVSPEAAIGWSSIGAAQKLGSR